MQDITINVPTNAIRTFRITCGRFSVRVEAYFGRGFRLIVEHPREAPLVEKHGEDGSPSAYTVLTVGETPNIFTKESLL
jgi:hypothetical protein